MVIAKDTTEEEAKTSETDIEAIIPPVQAALPNTVEEEANTSQAGTVLAQFVDDDSTELEALVSRLLDGYSSLLL